MNIFTNIHDFFVYTIWHKLIDKYYNIKWYFKNRRTFKKLMWTYRPWDFSYQEELFAFGLLQLRNSIYNGYEIRSTALKKVKAIDDLIYELKRDIVEEFPWNKDEETIDEYTKKIKFLKELRHKKINRIIVGQNEEVFKDLKSYDEFADVYDGTCAERWWD